MHIDFATAAQPFKEIHGANIGPLCQNGLVDLSPYHKQVRFPTIRLHDCLFYCWDVVDIPSIFPFFHLDAQDPKSYSFARTDGYIQSILNCGSKIVYRLGVTIQNHPEYIFHTDPPADYDKWADICIQIIRHYNERWADGFTHNIEYWEIWNEPEAGSKHMWNAPFEEYIRFYIQVTKRIKAACPNIKIGGPAFDGAMLTNQDRMHEFLPKIKEAGAPLDFCSWHAYPETPGQQVTAARNVRTILDDYGYTDTESHLNEWNIAPFRGIWGVARQNPSHTYEYIQRKKGAECGALAASCLIALQDAPVDMANFYEAANGIWGMFDLSGLPGKPYYAFLAFRDMLDNTPIRCVVDGSDPDNGLAVLAGRSEDWKTLQIMASNFHTPRSPFSMTLQGLPEGAVYTVTERKMDAYSNLETVDTFRWEASEEPFDILAAPQSMHLYTFRAE